MTDLVHGPGTVHVPKIVVNETCVAWAVTQLREPRQPEKQNGREQRLLLLRPASGVSLLVPSILTVPMSVM